jgi:hypothetical protein
MPRNGGHLPMVKIQLITPNLHICYASFAIAESLGN